MMMLLLLQVIARIEGDGSDNNLIVIGAHQDSIAGAAGNRAPGADDDGAHILLLAIVCFLGVGGARIVRSFYWPPCVIWG